VLGECSLPSHKGDEFRNDSRIILEEVAEAITSLPKGKALDHDRLPIEFFQENVEANTPMFFLAFWAMFSLGLASAFINKGMITLILKFGDHSKLRN